MAESAINDPAGHANVLHKYPANCSQNDYNNVKQLPLPDFPENISPLNLNDTVNTTDCPNAFNFANDLLLPNNNVSGDEGLMDCLMDGGCTSNTSITTKECSVSPSSSSFSPQTNSETHSQCSSIREPMSQESSATTDSSRPDLEHLDCKLKKQLIVKLETPPGYYDSSRYDEMSPHLQHDTQLHLPLPLPNYDNLNVVNNVNTNTNSGGVRFADSAVVGCKSVSFNSEVDYGDVSNGVIKKKRKNKDGSALGKSVGQKARVGQGRGRPPKRPLIATYHSQISGDKNTIKIRIKKSHLSSQVISPAKKSRQRKKQRKQEATDSEASDYDDSNKRVKIETAVVNLNDGELRPCSPQEQTVWGAGNMLPTEILLKIFQYACNEVGAIPLLVNLCKVCKLWRQVAISPELWETVDLSKKVKERSKIDIKLHWLIHNRLSKCKELILSDWKIKNIPAILEELCANCPEIRGLSLSGWVGMTGDDLKNLTSSCSKLERLDLSFVNGSNLGTKSALNAAPLVSMAQNVASRLTHLVLAHNKLAGFSQILTAISVNCPNLELLDLSNIKTHAYNSSLLHVEKLQEGCPKLRVLRVTNSQILLAPTSLTAQVASPGFPELEELSLAGIEDDNTTSKFIDDNGIERILKSSHKLRLLDVRGCTKITDSGLVRVPAWDLEHLFLSACYVTRLNHSGLELIVQKWSHSLVEVDLAWSTATEPLDAAVMTLAEKGNESPLRSLNLCGSSVSLESVKAVLIKCPLIQSLNLQSCRALPRGIKRLYEGAAVAELRSSLENKPKTEDLDSTGSEEPIDANDEKAATSIVSFNDNILE